MTGNWIIRNTNNDYLQIVGANDTHAGGSLMLCGNNSTYTQSTGDFSLKARWSTAMLKGYADGVLEWTGPVFKIGSTTINGDTIKRESSTSSLSIYGADTYTNGAYIQLHNGINDDGAFVFVSHTPTKSASLEGHATGSNQGSLTWCTNEVLTTANGLPLAGGAMSGVISKNADNSALTLKGGVVGNASAVLDLCGKDHPSAKGYFFLEANDGTNSKTLIGNPDGLLDWAGRGIVGGVNAEYFAIKGRNGANLILHDRNDTGKNGVYELIAENDAGYFRLEGHQDGYLHLQSAQYDYDLGSNAIVARDLKQNGYIKFVSGEIRQWGLTYNFLVGETYKDITLPLSFVNGFFSVVAIQQGAPTNGVMGCEVLGPSQFRIYRADSQYSNNSGCYWLAIGH